MLTQAIEKLKTEIAKSNNNPYIQVVGDFLLRHAEANPQDAEKILDKDKSIGKSLDAMKKAAEQKKVGNCAVLTDQEGFDIVLKYFRIGMPDEPVPAVTPAALEAPVSKTEADINYDEFDFLL